MQLPVQLRQPGKVKPYGSIPRINWRHPLAKNLAVYGYDVGGTVIDLINGGMGFTTTATAVGRGASRFGSGYKYTNGGGAVRLPFTPRINSVAPPFSIACSFFVTSAPASGVFFCLADTSAFGQPIYCAADSATAMRQGFNNGGADITYTASSILNDYHTMIGVGVSTSSTIAYFDGVSQGTGTTDPTVSFPTAAPTFNSFDLDGLSGNTTSGFLYYGALWTRALTASEALQLHLDPYCFLIYPEDEIFSTIVGSVVTAPQTFTFGPRWSDGEFSTEIVSY